MNWKQHVNQMNTTSYFKCGYLDGVVVIGTQAGDTLGKSGEIPWKPGIKHRKPVLVTPLSLSLVLFEKHTKFHDSMKLCVFLKETSDRLRGVTIQVCSVLIFENQNTYTVYAISWDVSHSRNLVVNTLSIWLRYAVKSVSGPAYWSTDQNMTNQKFSGQLELVFKFQMAESLYAVI